MAAPCGVLALPAACAGAPRSTWPSSCGFFLFYFFCFNPPSRPTVPSLPQRRSLLAVPALGSLLGRCRRAMPGCPRRVPAAAQPPPPPSMQNIYMCMIAVRTKRPAGPRGPGLPSPGLCRCRARPPAPLLCVAARGSGPSLSSFRLPQHLSEPGRRRCPSSPSVFSEYLSAPIFCTTSSPCPSLPSRAVLLARPLCSLATDAVS